MRVDVDVVPDEDNPHAILTVTDAQGRTVTQARVEASFKLTAASAQRWVDGGSSES